MEYSEVGNVNGNTSRVEEITHTAERILETAETEMGEHTEAGTGVSKNSIGNDAVGDADDVKSASATVGDDSVQKDIANGQDSQKTFDSMAGSSEGVEDDDDGDLKEDFVKVDPAELDSDKESTLPNEEKSSKATDAKEEGDKELEPGVVDVLGNGSLTKKVLVEAQEQDAAKPQQGDWVEVSYEMYIAGQEKVIESEVNRKICIHDMDIVQGIDYALMLMKYTEKAEIFVASDKAYGSLGRSEINVPPNTDLKFIITLERVCTTPEKDELIQIIERKKSCAKELFIGKDYEAAVYIYSRCLYHLDTVDLEKSDIALSIKSNLAQGFLNMQRYDLALQHAMTVVTHNPNDTKALLRLGKAYHKLGDLRRAERVLTKASNLEPSNKIILNELNTVKTKSKKSLDSQKKIYGRMFGLDKTEKSKKSAKKEGNMQYYIAGAVVTAGLASLCYSLFKSLS